MGMTDVKRRSLSAHDWTSAALEALARGGVAAVAVEPIAKSLRTTKGSFYWHFADRDALLKAALELWEQRDTERVISAVEESDDIRARLARLLRLTFTSAQQPSRESAGAVELALQASASHPLVASALTRVTERRLTFLTTLFTELGLPRREARDRALLAYTAFLGHAQLAHATPALLPTGRSVRTHVERVVEALTGVERNRVPGRGSPR
jgi:AcrR family transcriptional regulator